MMIFNPIYLIDFYKADHRSQYPKNTELVYSNWTARKSRTKSNKMVFFGLQYFLKNYFIDDFNTQFFQQPKDKVVSEYQAVMDRTLGPGLNVDHIGELHDLGYLPLSIEALPEGTAVPIQVPCMTFWNTHPKFGWLTNYFETLISAVIWKPCTSATSAWMFRKNFDKYADLTGADKGFCQFQGHDFSFRGMSGIEDAIISGMGHLLSFVGTDTLPAILTHEKYYNGTGLVGTSVRASEHSVMCCGGEETEYEINDRLLTEVYPNGIFSMVSDTYDFWKLVTEYLPSRKEMIMKRDGKLVIRPDTGIPHKVICGDPDGEAECEKKGLVRCLDNTFGSTLTPKSYKVLDSHIGSIYGDSIDFEEQELILSGLEKNGFASSNIVLGMGSYLYEYVTRDTYGSAIKATYCQIDGQSRNLFKSPKTGAWKKSRKGLLRVNPDMTVEEEVSWTREGGELKPVFYNGELKREQSLDEIRTLLSTQD